MSQAMPSRTGSGKYEALLDRCLSLESVPTAVAYPCEASALEGAVEAAEKNLINPILIGPADKIAETAKSANVNLSNFRIIDAADGPSAAKKSVELIREGKAEVLMKGSLHTDELMSAIVSREGGVRAGRRISHVCMLAVPTSLKVVIMTIGSTTHAPPLA